MIRTAVIKEDLKLYQDVSIDKLKDENISWCWVDIENPSEDEEKVLVDIFGFHKLAIEDALQIHHRPKLDHYDGYDFFILNALNDETLLSETVGIFILERFIVSVRRENCNEIDEAWDKFIYNENKWNKGPAYIKYLILDKIVDELFPAIQEIEDKLNSIDNNEDKKSVNQIIDEIFSIRNDLLKLRRLVTSMRDLLYRMLNSERLSWIREQKIYFQDIYDHLLKLSDMIEESREITADIRDNYISTNSNKMNINMMVLTVISTIFIPLTFIVGVYGMNFENIPELKWKYGYFVIWAIMALIGVFMFLWFKRKGWFDIDK
ncbi:magnesium/cobalt transporter CorA [Clostridium peptidivorans]|uniref:magnesium/cobalt transporter CorA n=1 Tax=Clostridium peptidivorans TaxID=100174 RepID=UPI000BE257CD|nr:magnesium/cobalt transporter CorA [Clostridium peptidivorans]